MPITRSQSKIILNVNMNNEDAINESNDSLAKWLYKNMCKYYSSCNLQIIEMQCENASFDILRLITEQIFIIGKYLPDILDTYKPSITNNVKFALIHAAEGLFHIYTKIYKRIQKSVILEWKIYWKYLSVNNDFKHGFKYKSGQVDLLSDDVNTIQNFLQVFEEQKQILESYIRIN